MIPKVLPLALAALVLEAAVVVPAFLWIATKLV